jgi:hypothetical protein
VSLGNDGSLGGLGGGAHGVPFHGGYGLNNRKNRTYLNNFVWLNLSYKPILNDK